MSTALLDSRGLHFFAIVAGGGLTCVTFLSIDGVALPTSGAAPPLPEDEGLDCTPALDDEQQLLDIWDEDAYPVPFRAVGGAVVS